MFCEKKIPAEIFLQLTNLESEIGVMLHIKQVSLPARLIRVADTEKIIASLCHKNCALNVLWTVSMLPRTTNFFSAVCSKALYDRE